MAALRLPSPSFPSSPPPACVQRFKNKPVSPHPAAAPPPPHGGSPRGRCSVAEWGALGLSFTVLPLLRSVQTTLLGL